MKGLLWLLAAFALAAGLSVALRGNEGYVLIHVFPWRVELSLALAVVSLLGIFLLFYGLVRAAAHVLGLPERVRAYRKRSLESKGSAAIASALEALHAGRFGRAEKLAAQIQGFDNAEGAAALIAARAAHRMRAHAKRDSWLVRLEALGPFWREARLALNAEFLLDERRFGEAANVLHALHASGPKHISTLQMLLRAEQGRLNWREVMRLAHILEKREAITREALESILVAARIATLAEQSRDREQLYGYWRSFGDNERINPLIAAAAARGFIGWGDAETAQQIIESAIDKGWDGELVRLYGEISGGSVLSRIENAELWLKSQPRDAELLLTLGRLCVQQGLWGKAQNCFEASLSLSAQARTCLALAQLFEKIGRNEDASRYFRAAATELYTPPGPARV